MSDRGILFSAPMVRALLDGRKTQTRRSLSPQPEIGASFQGADRDGKWLFVKGCFYGKIAPTHFIGDHLYVRESYYQLGHWIKNGTTPTGRQKWAFQPDSESVFFLPPPECRISMDKRNPGEPQFYKRLGRFMPKRYARTWLTVTDVRVERLQDISRADAIAEGLTLASNVLEEFWRWPEPHHERLWLSPPAAYQHLWNSLHDKPGERWADNPWVVAISFDVRKGNIDV